MFDEAGLMCYILGLRYWNSDDVRTLQSAELTASFTETTKFLYL